jgi:hypothetical protein
MGHSRHHLHLQALSYYDLEQVRGEPVAVLVAHRLTDDSEPVAVEGEVLHEVRMAATVGYHEASLVTELMRARQRWYSHQHFRPAYETSERPCVLLQTRYRYRSRPRSQSHPPCGRPLLMAQFLVEKVALVLVEVAEGVGQLLATSGFQVETKNDVDWTAHWAVHPCRSRNFVLEVAGRIQ